MKKCFKCGKEKELESFYKHPKMMDGHLGKCKSCTIIDSSAKNGLHIGVCFTCKESFKKNRGNRKYCTITCRNINYKMNPPVEGMRWKMKDKSRLVKYWLGKKRPDMSLIMKGKKYALGFKQTDEMKRKNSIAHQQEKSYAWKGENVGYSGLHIWVKRYKGTPDTCEHCGKSGLFNKKNQTQIHWANKSHKYKRDLEDWIRLCVICHSKYDRLFLNK